MTSNPKDPITNQNEKPISYERKETEIFNPTMKEVAKLVDETIDENDFDVLGEFKKKQNQNEDNEENENKNDENLEDGKSLKHIHRMSMRKIELGRMRSKLINTSAKIDKYAEEVNIDKARAEKMADKFFKRRLKHIDLEKLRVNSEENFKNRSLKFQYPDFVEFNKNFIHRLEKKNSTSQQKIKNLKYNTQKNKESIENYQNKNKNINKDINADNKRIIPIPKIKMELISNPRSYQDLRENKKEVNKGNLKSNKIEVLNQIKKVNINQTNRLNQTQIENNRRNKIDNRPVKNTDRNSPNNNNYNKPVNRNNNNQVNRNDHKNIIKKDIKAVELSNNKNGGNLRSNSNTSFNIGKNNKTSKTIYSVNNSPRSTNINISYNTSRGPSNKIPMNKIEISKIPIPRGSNTSRGNKSLYNNSLTQREIKNNNINTNIFNTSMNNNRRPKNEEPKVINKGTVVTVSNNRRRNTNLINEKEPKKEVKKIENKNQRINEINLNNKMHKNEEKNKTTINNRRNNNISSKPIPKNPETKSSITTTVSPRRKAVK